MVVIGVLASGVVASTGAQAQEVPEVSVSVAPSPFSPNRDGRKDHTDITVQVSLPSSLTVTIETRDGDILRTWREDPTGDAPVVIRWNGRTGGNYAPDARYRVRAVAQTIPEGAAPTAALEGQGFAPVIVDTRAPRIRRARVRPDPVFGHRRVRMRFVARDRAAQLRAKAVIRNAVRTIREVTRRVGRGATGIGWPARYRGGGRLFPGPYRATLRLSDDAGNVSRARTIPWRVHRAAPGGVYTRLPAGRRVALTFDDCHLNSAWPRILRILRAHRVHATFFCPGGNVAARPDYARRTIRDGHTAGAHAWDHASLAGHSAWFTAWRLRRDAGAWWKAARTTSAPFMRPPYGAYDGTVIRAAGSTGHPRVVMWDVDPMDWTLPGSSTIASRVLSRSRRGSIILLHTLHMTADALPRIIRGLRNRGLQPVTLPELFAAAGMR